MIVEDNVVSLPGDRRTPARRGSGSCPATRWRCRTPRPARLLGLPGGRPLRLGRLPGRVPARARRICMPSSSVFCEEQGAGPLPDGVYPRIAVAQPLPVPRGGRLPARAAARADLAPAGVIGASPGRRRSICRSDLASGDGAPDLPLARLAWLRRRRPDAAPGRRARATTAPLHRLEGAAGSSVELATTCGARSSCPSPPSCRWSTWRSPTAATTRPPSASTSASRWSSLPVFWDQYDNAQRVDETGFGVRLGTYAFADHELHDAIERLLADALKPRKTISTRLQACPAPCAPPT